MAVVPLGIINDILPESREMVKITNRSDGVFTLPLVPVQQQLFSFDSYYRFVLCLWAEIATKYLPKTFRTCQGVYASWRNDLHR